jgi:flagellar hook-length control protein FliK
MNLSSTDSIGLASIFESLAPPTGAAMDDAPAEVSFDAVLNEPASELPSCPLPDRQEPQEQKQQASSSDAHQGAGEMTAETAHETPPEYQPVVRSGPDEEPSDYEVEESSGTAAVVVVPTVVLDALPTVEQAGEAVQTEAETTAQSSRKHVSTAVTATAAAIEPIQPIVATGVVASADDEVATGQRDGMGASSINEIEPAKKRPSSDDGEETGRGQGQPLKNQSEIYGELAMAQDPAASGIVEVKRADAPTPVVPAAEAAHSTTAPSPNTPIQQPLAPRLLPELVSAGTGRAARDSDAPQIDSARLLNRVARAFAAAQDGGGEVRLRLSPPELGALRLEVKVLDGVLVARCETETSSARTALIENLPALRERLAEQGVRIERFDVELMQRHNGGSFDRPANQQPQDQPPQPPVVPRARRLPQVAEGVVARTTIASDLDQRRLNVIV